MTVDLTFQYQDVLAPGDIKLLELCLTDEQRRQFRGAAPKRMWFWRSDACAQARRRLVGAAPFEILGIDYDGHRALIGPALVFPIDKGTPWALNWPALDAEPPKIMVRSRDRAVGIIIEIECEAPALQP